MKKIIIIVTALVLAGCSVADTRDNEPRKVAYKRIIGAGMFEYHLSTPIDYQRQSYYSTQEFEVGDVIITKYVKEIK